MSTNEPTILIVIVRDRENSIIFRVANIGAKDAAMLEAIAAAWIALREEAEAVRVEVHAFEDGESNYIGKPLAVLTTDDIIF